MPAKHEKKLSSNQSLILSLGIALLFAALLITMIYRLNTREPNTVDVNLELQRLGKMLEQSAMNAHWKWLANKKPYRLLLTHYNDEGSEIGRTPVVMSRDGWPQVSPTSEGCSALWRSLLTEPMMMGEFKIYGEFYRAQSQAQPDKCRFRLSTGGYFDYYISTGTVVLNKPQ